MYFDLRGLRIRGGMDDDVVIDTTLSFVAMFIVVLDVCTLVSVVDVLELHSFLL